MPFVVAQCGPNGGPDNGSEELCGQANSFCCYAPQKCQLDASVGLPLRSSSFYWILLRRYNTD